MLDWQAQGLRSRHLCNIGCTAFGNMRGVRTFSIVPRAGSLHLLPPYINQAPATQATAHTL